MSQQPNAKPNPAPAKPEANKTPAGNADATYSPDVVKGVYDFLKQTPEGSVRKMLCVGPLTDGHFRLLMKLVKGGPEAEFIDAFNKNDMGKLRLNPKEAPLKDGFWKIVKGQLASTGLLPTGKAA